QENEYQGEENETLVKFAKQHESHTHADYYIFGHRHIMLDLMIAKESRIIILGDCIQHFSYAYLDEEGALTLNTLE
ncbi:MAG: UDP-2,3-diacylglucosamine diphosphatase, partial [Paludibacteraceae bacterium]|nr:UDP-2,3-diacylglucosamine diphosphatase [Paludibacteraceae bacterium]